MGSRQRGALLALARPELRDRRPSLVEVGGPSSSVIVLGGLDEAAGRQPALDLLAADDLPNGVLSRALDASEGNPLFLRELLRLLVDDGVLLRVDGTWKATIDEGGIEMPPTIHALLAARIERLRPEERTVLERAAVVGRHFSPQRGRGAVAARGASPISTRDSNRAARSEVIERDTGGWFLGEPVLRFPITC